MNQEQIVQRIKDRQGSDMLGFETDMYLVRLDFEHAREFIKDSVTAEEWGEPRTKNLTDVMLDYITFAFEKANDERGISANRSIMHYIAWLWLAEEDELLRRVEWEYKNNYHSYGKPILIMICEHFEWDWKQWDY